MDQPVVPCTKPSGLKGLKISLIIVSLFFVGVIAGYFLPHGGQCITPTIIPPPRTLDKYTIDNLSKTTIKPSVVTITEKVGEYKDFNSYIFTLKLDPTLAGKEERTVSGLINIPNGAGPFPLVIMIRGYVDQKQYTTGTGTKRAGEYLAQNGFITIAPDFLGYGTSDSEAGNIFESRFQTYTTILSLVSSLASIDKYDQESTFIWAHSNGGQIAITTLEITGKVIPTVLWAPVSKPFPYSVLYYTDESDDKGKLIREELAKFEQTYDVNLYSMDSYLDRISAPIRIHQGTADTAVPVSWSKALEVNLKNLDKDVVLTIHPGADHNMSPAWNSAIKQDLTFFQKFIDK